MSYSQVPNGTTILPQQDRVDWWAEGRAALLIGAFSTVLGGLVGVLWHAFAPVLRVQALAGDVTEALKPMIGDDLWLALIGVVAGIVCVLGLHLVSRHAASGPGGQVGLAAGGVLGALVAARVGHLLGHRELADGFHAHFSYLTPSQITALLKTFDFSIRMKAVLMAWPLTAVLLNSLVIGVRVANEPTQVRVAAYPGSS